MGGGELAQRDCHDHGLQQIESLMIVGLGGNEFLKDAQETGELRPVSTDDLRRSLLHEGLKKADERWNKGPKEWIGGGGSKLDERWKKDQRNGVM